MITELVSLLLLLLLLHWRGAGGGQPSSWGSKCPALRVFKHKLKDMGKKKKKEKEGTHTCHCQMCWPCHFSITQEAQALSQTCWIKNPEVKFFWEVQLHFVNRWSRPMIPTVFIFKRPFCYYLLPHCAAWNILLTKLDSLTHNLLYK